VRCDVIAEHTWGGSERGNDVIVTSNMVRT
jgi:hypothetical protein